MVKSQISGGEPQYDYLWGDNLTDDPVNLGVMSSETWRKDPKRLGFVLARYKFVSKMLRGKQTVLEVGCGDGWASAIVRKEVQELHLSDFDPRFLRAAIANGHSENLVHLHDFTKVAMSGFKFDGIYLLDVFEHISSSNENNLLTNLKLSLNFNGALIIGAPTAESQAYIPVEKRDAGHVNCKNGEDFHTLLSDHFHNVFLFSMNDEVVQTSPSHLAFYNLLVCTSPK